MQTVAPQNPATAPETAARVAQILLREHFTPEQVRARAATSPLMAQIADAMDAQCPA